MEAVNCPYCGEQNHTSAPQILAECAYCDHRFAEVREDFQTLVILDGEESGAWEMAEKLTCYWQEHGQLEKEVIVDRRLNDSGHEGSDHRRSSGLAMQLHG